MEYYVSAESMEYVGEKGTRIKVIISRQLFSVAEES